MLVLQEPKLHDHKSSTAKLAAHLSLYLSHWLLQPTRDAAPTSRIDGEGAFIGNLQQTTATKSCCLKAATRICSKSQCLL